MSDNLKLKKVDRTKISTKESWEREYWTNSLDVSIQQLNGAIKATGSHGVKTIKSYLKDKK